MPQMSDPLSRYRKATPAMLHKALVAGAWHQKGGRVLIRRFGGSEHPAPPDAKRGPNQTLLIGRELMVASQQP